MTGALVFIGQALVLWLLAVWGLRKVGLDPEVANPAAWRRQQQARRQAAERSRLAQAEYVWLCNVSWWLQERNRHDPGAREYEAANDSLAFLYRHRPGPCRESGFTCRTPDCPSHPRSNRS